MTDHFDAAVAAAELLRVRRGGSRPAGLPVLPPDPAAAYAVQRAVLSELGGGAWKMALLGGHERHAAALPGALVLASGDTLPPLPEDACIEVETALILGADLNPGADMQTALAAIGEVRLCFEIVCSRFADRTVVHPLEAMADAFSSGAIVLGEAIPEWRDVLAASLGIRLWLEDRLIQAPETLHSLQDALSFLCWLAGHAAEQGLPLRQGDIIITGARIGPLPLEAAAHACAAAAGAKVAINLQPAP